MNSKGQITLWVIIAMAFFVSIILFFTISKSPEIFKSKEFSPEQFISDCVKREAKSALEIMLPQGGFVNPNNYVLYQGGKVTYLCENMGSFKPCINQHPMLLTEMQNEIINEISGEVGKCFSQLVSEIENEDYRVSIGPQNMSIDFGPDRIKFNIQRELIMSKEGDNKRFNEFNVDMISPAYDLARIAQEVISQEAKFCYFEYVGYMTLYPRFDIRLDRIEDSTKVYIVKDKRSNEEMRFAVRGCAIFAGI